jgi:hypothetical protein
MSIVRMASWYLIGLLISIWAVVAFTVKAILIASEDHYWGVWPTVCMVFVSGAVWVARRCRRALKNARIEIAQHAMPEPETPPDFSTLNNGRDRWKELEHIR